MSNRNQPQHPDHEQVSIRIHETRRRSSYFLEQSDCPRELPLHHQALGVVPGNSCPSFSLPEPCEYVHRLLGSRQGFIDPQSLHVGKSEAPVHQSEREPFARLSQQKFRSLKVNQRAGDILLRSKGTEYAAEMRVYFSGALGVSYLLVDFNAISRCATP